jgi:GNAT superfamily N-acetyltransferase
MTKIRATIRDEVVLTWDSQVVQYPTDGPLGISYFKGEIDEERWVDCLLFRTETGELIGILNRYPFDFYPYEVVGNVNIWVHPDHQRKGIASALIRVAAKRWEIKVSQQRFTHAGLMLAQKMIDQGVL